MKSKENSYNQILKSTGIVGGSQIFIILISIVKTKIIAILLGPSGVGVVGMYQSIVDLVKNITGFGINFSGVKDIAAAHSSGDIERIGKSLKVLKYWAWGTGLLGLAVMILFSFPLSFYTFGSYDYVIGIVLLSVVPLITSVSGGQLAVLQGTRSLADMAKANLIGALIGLFFSLLVYWVIGIKGVVLVLILTSVTILGCSWFYSRHIRFPAQGMSFKEWFGEGLGMAKLGFFIVVSGTFSVFTLYLIRIFIVKNSSIDTVGYFQASWTITNMYVSVILNAMLADFFPRLTAMNSDREGSVKLINQQMEIALLVGMPMVIGLMSFSPWIIKVLYSKSFVGAIDILVWQLAGSLLTFVMWTLGVVFLARGAGKYVIVTDLIWNVVFLFSIYLGWNRFGIEILGIGFVIAGLVKLGFVIFITRHMILFRFSRENMFLIVIFLVVSLLVIIVHFSNISHYSIWIGTLLFIISCFVSIYFFNRKVDLMQIVKSFSNKFAPK